MTTSCRSGEVRRAERELIRVAYRARRLAALFNKQGARVRPTATACKTRELLG